MKIDNEKENLDKAFKRFKNGDKKSFEVIYNNLKNPLFVIIFRIVQNRETAEDITHDVFIKLFYASCEISDIKAYVFQMGRNSAIDSLRRKENSAVNIEDTKEELSTDGNFDSLIEGLDIEKAFLKLTVLQREIVSLHLNGELTFVEISKLLKISVASVYRKYRKAVRILRDELNGVIL